jgi:hypothetical protein
MGLRPSRLCSATTLNGNAALPVVISTGAPKERSGEICGYHSLDRWFAAANEKVTVIDTKLKKALLVKRSLRLCDPETDALLELQRLDRIQLRRARSGQCAKDDPYQGRRCQRNNRRQS